MFSPQERRIALKENLLRSITQDEGGVLEGEPLDIDSYITDMERELERRSKNSQRKVGNQWYIYCYMPSSRASSYSDIRTYWGALVRMVMLHGTRASNLCLRGNVGENQRGALACRRNLCSYSGYQKYS